jgi:hypothetical protein
VTAKKTPQAMSTPIIHMMEDQARLGRRPSQRPRRRARRGRLKVDMDSVNHDKSQLHSAAMRACE